MKLGVLRNTLHGIKTTELSQILRLFGRWPTPPDSARLDNVCLAAIWFADYLACMGILDHAMRTILLEELKPRLTGWAWDAAGPVRTPQDDCGIRLADRRFLFVKPNEYLDLTTGTVVCGLPAYPFVDKQILDLHAIYTRRSRELTHVDPESDL
jgi:hypothetical protein